jgi:acetyltransferase-like isoleucine patch superfamily enzyme
MRVLVEKIKKMFRVFNSIDIDDFIKYNFNKNYRGEGWFFPYRNSYFDINKKSNISINCSYFHFNRKTHIHDPSASYLVMEDGAKLIVNGSFSIFSGSRVGISKDASVILGSSYINHNFMLICYEKITIGNNVAISNNVVIRDSDAHKIVSNESHKMTKAIEIGDHVWIGTNATILKGVKIGNGAIIGANSLVNKDVPENVLVAGVPARIIKENVKWQ